MKAPTGLKHQERREKEENPGPRVGRETEEHLGKCNRSGEQFGQGIKEQ